MTFWYLVRILFQEEELRNFLLLTYCFFFFFLSALLISLIIYVSFLFRHYTSFMGRVFKENLKEGVLHEFSYSWLRGVKLTIISPSPKKDDGDSPVKSEEKGFSS